MIVNLPCVKSSWPSRAVYGGADVSLTPQAEQDLAELEGLGFGSLPVCVAKTQYSLSDDAKKLGAPKDFTLTVRALRISAAPALWWPWLEIL